MKNQSDDLWSGQIKEEAYTEEFPIEGSDKKIQLSFREKSLEVEPDIKALVIKLLSDGYSYIFDVLGKDAVVGTKNKLLLKNSGIHGTDGVEININVERLALADERKMEQEQSLIVHEILHHTVIEEHLPMFLELIYMLEKNQKWRFEELKSMFAIPKFKSKYPKYLQGFQQIAEWLGCADEQELLTKIQEMDPNALKEIFKEKYEEYCHEDPTLAAQMKSLSVDSLIKESKENAEAIRALEIIAGNTSTNEIVHASAGIARQISTVNGKIQDQVDLKIDWTVLEPENLYESFNEYEKLGSGTFYECSLPGLDGEELSLKFKKLDCAFNGSKDAVMVELTRENNKSLLDEQLKEGAKVDWDIYHVADFDFVRIETETGEEWNMKHRRTGKRYRNQNIAGKILEIVENCLRSRSLEKKVDTSLTCSVGQKELLAWLGKRAYTPATEEDEAKLARINKTENGLQILSSPGGEKYMFDAKAFREKFGFEASSQKVWNTKNYHEDFYYMKSAYKVKLRKIIS